MVKAIETNYQGYRFRSRTEARWAVFFDVLGVRWEYEAEGFDLESGPYLPDFLLPDLGFWIEIKGAGHKLTARERQLCFELEQATGKHVYIHHGNPYRVGIEFEESLEAFVSPCDYAQWWCECPDCGAVGIEYEGRAARLPCGCVKGDRGHNYDSWRLLSAYRAARRARFEYGECPNTSAALSQVLSYSRRRGKLAEA